MLSKFLKALPLILISWLIIHTIIITIDGLSDQNKIADVGVILGNKVNSDGTLSNRLKARLECGLQLFQAKRVKKIIVSGGLGKEGFYEGDKMREYLISHKVPDSCIIIDNQGNNSQLTVSNSIELFKTNHFETAIVVSQFYHVSRTKMLFRKARFNEVSSVCPNYFELRDFYSLCREFFAYYSAL
jgi:vancomycin permeability regulator SanA